jgi:hypothetical protein
MALHARGRTGGYSGYIGGADRAAPAPSGVREFESLLSSARCAPGSPWYDAARDCPRPSHNDLFGGTFAVQDCLPDAETTFHGSLVQALREGGVYGLSENRTRYSALYFDLDICGERAPVDVPTLRGLAALICEVVVRLAGKGNAEGHEGRTWREACSAVIATAPAQQQSGAGHEFEPGRGPEPLWKTGAHILFPDVVLDRASMARVAVAARDHVERTLGPRPPPCNAWADVFDTGVYRAGLRMLLVDKPGPCPHCHGAAPTAACGPARCRKGKVPMRRPYRPVAYLRGEDGADDAAALRMLLCNPVLALKRCSIRRPNAAHPAPLPPRFDDDAYFPPEPAPHGLDASPRGVAGSSAQGKAALTALLGPAPGVTRASVSRVVLLPSDARLKVLERAVRGYAPDGRFARLCVRGATANGAGTVFSVQVVGEGHRSCLNCLPGKVHSRAAVSFLVDAERGVSQRCTSRSDKRERATGRPCRDFAAPWRALPEELARALFGGIMRTAGPLPIMVTGDRVWLPPGTVVTAEEEARASEQAAPEPRRPPPVRLRVVPGRLQQEEWGDAEHDKGSEGAMQGRAGSAAAHTVLVENATVARPLAACPPGLEVGAPSLSLRDSGSIGDPRSELRSAPPFLPGPDPRRMDARMALPRSWVAGLASGGTPILASAAKPALAAKRPAPHETAETQDGPTRRRVAADPFAASLAPSAPLGVTRDAIAAAPPLGPSGAPLGVAPPAGTEH